MNFCPTRRLSSLASALVCLLGVCTVALAQTGVKNAPTSRVYVADLTGESAIDAGGKIQPLVKDAVHPAEGSVIETKSNSTDSLVLSNGTALYVTPDTRVEVKRFSQEPFAPNRADLDIEPSVSQTTVRLVRGGLGVCTSKLVAGSTLVFQTAQGTVHVRGRRLHLQVSDVETRVSLLEGDITVVADGSSNGTTLRPGEQALLRQTSPDGPVEVLVQPIPPADNAAVDEAVTFACLSRRTVYFESVDSPDGGAATLVPIRTVPANLPTQFTVSPARING